MQFLRLTKKPKMGDTIYYISPGADPIPLTVKGFCGDGDRIVKFVSQYLDDQIIWKFVPNDLAPREYNEYLFIVDLGSLALIKQLAEIEIDDIQLTDDSIIFEIPASRDDWHLREVERLTGSDWDMAWIDDDQSGREAYAKGGGMTIDTLLNPTRLTASETHAALGYVMAVSEAIREAGEIASGTLYAMLCDRLSIGAYQSLLGMLKRTGLVEDRGHLLVWVGPKLETKS